MKIVGGVLLWLLTATVCSLWSGFVLMKLWGWFMVPTFHLPALSIGHALGVGATVGYLSGVYSRNQPNDEEKKGPYAQIVEAGIRALLIGGYILAFGAIVKAFI